MGTALAFTVLLALAVLCVAAFLVVRVLSPESLLIALPPSARVASSPSPDGVTAPSSTAAGQAAVSIDPQEGSIGSLVRVVGQGWAPNEPVFVFLRSPAEVEARRYSYAAALADESGSFQTAFTFPREARWSGQTWAEVTAQGSRSGRTATARFGLLAPTAASTVPVAPSTPTALPTDTPQPTPTPSPEPVITDWRGEYFANPELIGPPALVRNDARIDMDWAAEAPAIGLPADGFSVRWSRLYEFRRGTYDFTVAADDGVRFWIDGQLYVDEWHDSSFTAHSFELDLSRGKHWLVLEYYEGFGLARVSLDWARLEPPTATPVPTSTPEPIATPPPFEPGSWLAEYYANPELDGMPVLTREEPRVDFDWGQGSPGEGIPEDHFSARWTQELWLPAGTYSITLDVDDGARVWVDDVLLIDAWQPSGGASYSAQIWIPEGRYRIRIEYFEDTLSARARATIEAVPGPARGLP